MPMVIDASIAIAWSFNDQRDPESIEAGRAIFHDQALVPAIWAWEIQNVLRNAEKRGRITEARSGDVLRELAALPIRVDLAAPAALFGHELDVARRFSLTVYDAVYLDLAMRRGARLATKDDALRRAAASVGLFWSSSD